MASVSEMIPLGTTAPDFNLREVTNGALTTLDDLPGDALVVMFLSRHCPYVVHVQEGLSALVDEYVEAGRPVSFVGICSNDAASHPDDAPESLAEQKRLVGFSFPYLHDETQEVARAYGAACTPDFFVFDADRRLAYRGQMDGARPGNDEVPVSGIDLRKAIDLVLDGKPVPEPHLPSRGCGIKWRG